MVENPRSSPKAPTFGATEGDQALTLAIFAAYAQESVIKATAFEEILELLLDKSR